ncbi:hypothetical protein [Lactobacillus iners]|jgi:hypothetical protein|uniref:Uncharacterized protein n=1 Tax=Lactobacillus iners TaxID=147802 RepID=A0A6G7B9Z7_9LACO|nr:hypothetical protein [Lactobacillus iners]EFO66327.1 hypothetical protein HMPREF9214_0363 [Lactobacillus iners LactinV 11V1-d]EFO68311.1 hypothetical protein HMPREF9213_0123 [Lactobacillus iners LactinV 09V1-c]EFO72342.1 hypothetical protein HMPREF9215_0747 [Lactobacillus iners SPIN 2503V10-D]EFU78197.1 hypothetical protein HMPREF9223_0812 [Lactobacillus iners ATCC 55195]EGC79912.1 hypothetical protein HMPREF0522_1194 [Lactobacillus iners UPII 143-D]
MNGNGIVIILLCLAAIIVLLTEILNILIKQFPDNSVCKKIWCTSSYGEILFAIIAMIYVFVSYDTNIKFSIIFFVLSLLLLKGLHGLKQYYSKK